MQQAPMLRTPRAAEFLGVSPATLCKWRVLGGGPRFKKLGRAVVYDPADLRDWLDGRSKVSTSAEPIRAARQQGKTEKAAATRDASDSA